MTKENYVVARQIHPKNKQPYIFVMDKPSLSVKILFGPRKTKIQGELSLSDEELQILKNLRKSKDIKNYWIYPLTNFI